MLTNNATCFDYIPAQNPRHYTESGQNYFPYGESVAQSISRVTPFIAPLLNPEKEEQLRTEAQKAVKFSKNVADSNKSNHQPISNPVAERFPIYACLAHHAVTSDPQTPEGISPGKFVCDIARVAALIFYLRPEKGEGRGGLTPHFLANFTRQLGKVSPEVKLRLYQTCVNFSSNNFDTALCIATLQDIYLSAEHITADRSDLVKFAPQLIDILTFLEHVHNERQGALGADTPVESNLRRIQDRLTSPPKAKPRQKLSEEKGPQEPYDEEGFSEEDILHFDGQEDNLDSLAFDAILSDQEHPVSAQRSLAQIGQWVRYNDLLSGSGRQNAIPSEAVDTIKFLIEMTPNTPEQVAARWIWLIALLNGRHFNEVADAIKRSEPNHQDGRIEKIDIQESVTTLTVRHPVASKLAKHDSG